MPSEIASSFHQWVKTIQDQICDELSQIDGARFKEDEWSRSGGGGGQSRILSNGSVFEKAGVNVSEVFGPVSTEMAPMFKQMCDSQGVRMPESDAAFYATGVSLVVHPRNPFVPTTHANFRYFELKGADSEPIWWVGGGADMTPYYLFEEDARDFHLALKGALDRLDPQYYPRFKAQCDQYFYLPHRQEARGIGGIFYDYLNQHSPDHYLQMHQGCAAAFSDVYGRIVRKRMHMSVTEANRHWQQVRRGRYVEFNLIYDRGTLFGLKTNGRTESILMSLPPVCEWVYNQVPEPESPEGQLLACLKAPRAWV